MPNGVCQLKCLRQLCIQIVPASRLFSFSSPDQRLLWLVTEKSNHKLDPRHLRSRPRKSTRRRHTQLHMQVWCVSTAPTQPPLNIQRPHQMQQNEGVGVEGHLLLLLKNIPKSKRSRKNTYIVGKIRSAAWIGMTTRFSQTLLNFQMDQ